MIYFDNAATTRPIAELSKLAEEYQKDMWFNPSAMYHGQLRRKTELANAEECSQAR